MVTIKLSRRKRPAPREEVVKRIQEFAEVHNNSLSLDAYTMTLSWTDGPSLEEVYDTAIADTNWELREKVDGINVGNDDGIVYASRSLSIVAQAIAVVRFAGAKSRPLNISDPKDREFYTTLLRESVLNGKWQMAEHMAKYLVELTDEPKDDTAIANKFIEVGYEKLWNRAFTEMN